MSEKKEIEEEIERLMKVREDFLNFLDENLPKNEKTKAFDFSNKPTLDAQEVYSNFFKLDYQARKLRGYLVKAYDLKP